MRVFLAVCLAFCAGRAVAHDLKPEESKSMEDALESRGVPEPLRALVAEIIKNVDEGIIVRLDQKVLYQGGVVHHDKIPKVPVVHRSIDLGRDERDEQNWRLLQRVEGWSVSRQGVCGGEVSFIYESHGSLVYARLGASLRPKGVRDCGVREDLENVVDARDISAIGRSWIVNPFVSNQR